VRETADLGKWEGVTREEISKRAEALKTAILPEQSEHAPGATALDRLERRVLAALLIDHHRPSPRLIDRNDLAADYFIVAPGPSLDAILNDFGSRGVVELSADKDGTSAILRPDAVRGALTAVMADLRASQLEIDWPRERVLSDGVCPPDFPLPKGWLFLSWENEGEAPEVIRVDSASWTGPPRGSALNEQQRAKFLAGLREMEDKVQSTGLGNSDRAQVLAFLGAARELTEAPTPPADIIWELISRASKLAGIGSFFLSLVALFASIH
jgi:hypothetical protein